MTTQYSPILKLALPVQGELSGTWGDVVNDNITSMVEQAIAGRAVINTWTTNSHTLTSANGTTSESRCAMLELTDTGTALSGAGTVVCPTASKIYIVKNAAGQNITVKTSGGTGILVPNGRTTFLFCDGTNVVEAMTHTTSLQLGTSTTVTAVLDEDNMASDSATSLATQQSIKAYVDAQVGANNELSEVLANGNTSGANDIIVDNGQKITTNTIDETTAGSGVTIDSVLLKDDGVNATNLEVTNIKANDGTAAGSIADSTGVVTVASAVLTTADINGGTADGVVIGGTTPAAATVTTAVANTSLTIAGTTTVTSILDEDNMASDDPAGLATQQSIKAYVDAQVGTVDTLAEVLANGNTTGGTDIAVSAGDDITFADSSKAIFGAGSDLSVYHDGTRSHIEEAGLGGLWISTNGTEIKLKQGGGVDEEMLVATPNGSVDLYYNNNLKLATTSTGIDVTGDITLGDANPTITFNDSSVTNLSHAVRSASDNLQIAVDVNGVDAGSRVEIFDGATEVARFSAGAVDVTGTITADGLTVDTDAYRRLLLTYPDAFTSKLQVGFSNFYVQGSATNDRLTIANNSSGQTHFENQSKTSMVIDNSGDISFYDSLGSSQSFYWDASEERLGIGTTSPNGKFETYSNAGVGGSNYSALVVDQTSESGAAALSLTSLFTNTNNTNKEVAAIKLGTVTDGGATPSADIRFETISSNSLSERMRIDASGIDVTGQLDVNSAARIDSSGIVKSANGTAAAPTHAFLNDPDNGMFRPTTNTVGFSTAGTERMRISSDGSCRWTPDGTNPDMTLDASGNLLVGTTTILAAESNVEGISLAAGSYGGLLSVSRDGNRAATFNRKTSDGDIVQFRKDGATVGSIGSRLGANIVITAPTATYFDSSIRPLSDDSKAIGTSTLRFTNLYLSNAVVQDGVKATTTATTQVAIDTFAHASHDGAKVVITAATSADTYVTELLIATNGTTAVATEYGQIGTGSALATYDVDISGADVRILATPASTTSTTFRVAMTLT